MSQNSLVTPNPVFYLGAPQISSDQSSIFRQEAHPNFGLFLGVFGSPIKAHPRDLQLTGDSWSFFEVFLIVSQSLFYTTGDSKYV